MNSLVWQSVMWRPAKHSANAPNFRNSHPAGNAGRCRSDCGDLQWKGFPSSSTLMRMRGITNPSQPTDRVSDPGSSTDFSVSPRSQDPARCHKQKRRILYYFLRPLTRRMPYAAPNSNHEPSYHGACYDQLAGNAPSRGGPGRPLLRRRCHRFADSDRRGHDGPVRSRYLKSGICDCSPKTSWPCIQMRIWPRPRFRPETVAEPEST